MADRVVPIKIENPETGGTQTDETYVPANKNQDALEARGFLVQNDTSDDSGAGISRDAGDNLILFDPNVGSRTLASLIASGGTPLYDFLLETDPNYTGFTYDLTYTGSYISRERWRLTSTLKAVKTSDYTYAGGRVSTEVDKIYGGDGITVVAQTTTSYSYAAGKVSGYVRTRDV